VGWGSGGAEIRVLGARNDNALRLQGIGVMLLWAASLHHTGVMLSDIAMSVKG
jgi:hypothetical protein